MNEEMTVVEREEPVERSVTAEDIRSMVYTVRGKQVMLDSDLAKLYGVETSALNRAMKRNQKRFPDSFCFQLEREEYYQILRCQFGTLELKQGQYAKYSPYVYTEQGVAMLTSVLHSDRAIEASIQIMMAFVEMRKFIANNAVLFDRISSVELKQLEYQKRTDARLDQIFEYIGSHEETVPL